MCVLTDSLQFAIYSLIPLFLTPHWDTYTHIHLIYTPHVQHHSMLLYEYGHLCVVWRNEVGWGGMLFEKLLCRITAPPLTLPSGW